MVAALGRFIAMELTTLERTLLERLTASPVGKVVLEGEQGILSFARSLGVDTKGLSDLGNGLQERGLIHRGQIANGVVFILITDDGRKELEQRPIPW
jgi:hypothetical protein